MYKLKLSRREKKKLFRLRWLFVFLALVALGLVVWLAWIRPIQKESNINSFEECVAAGNPVQESYPEVCLTNSGKRFANTKQDQAHQASLNNEEELVPPSNPALLVLDVEEWGVRIPLSIETFDLTYAYIEDGGSEHLFFTYKRLIRLGVCKGDIGLKLTRSYVLHTPPYSAQNPAPTAQLDKMYFYADYAEKPCYDAGNTEQASLVKTIAGDKSLTEATAAQISKLTAVPKE